MPVDTAPGLKGPSNLTRNHCPNSVGSVRASQTRETGAPNSIVLTIRSAKTRNLLGTDHIFSPCLGPAFVGDKAFDAAWLLDDLEGRGAEAVIPPRRNRTEPREHDRDMYGWRHLVENFFAKIKEFRAIVTRYDKTDASFAAGIHLVAGVVAAK